MKVLTLAVALLAASSEALNVKKAFRFGRSNMPEDSTSAAAPAPAPAAAVSSKPVSSSVPGKDVSEIFVGNKKFIESKLNQDPTYFNTLGTVHKPKYLYIGKSALECRPARILTV
jgi:carbonic anhydrase